MSSIVASVIVVLLDKSIRAYIETSELHGLVEVQQGMYRTIHPCIAVAPSHAVVSQI